LVRGGLLLLAGGGGVITWRIVRGGVRSVLEGFFGEFLKRRIKDFDHYFPTKKKGLGGLRR